MAALAPSSVSHVPPSRTFSARSFVNRVQDVFFDALAELRYGLDHLALAPKYDAQESEIEQAVFGDMEQCRCQCCSRLLPRLLQADEFDHLERANGWEPSVRRVGNAAAFLRRGSTEVERDRLALIGSRQAKLRVVES